FVVMVTRPNPAGGGGGAGAAFAVSASTFLGAGAGVEDGQKIVAAPNPTTMTATPAAIHFQGIVCVSGREVDGSCAPAARSACRAWRLSARDGAEAWDGGSSLTRMLVAGGGPCSRIEGAGGRAATGEISKAGGAAASGVHDSVSGAGS